MNITLQLDFDRRKTLQELFLTSAQSPSLGLSNLALKQDASAVFRVAKEFTQNQPGEESRVVHAVDTVRMLRFVCWLLSYDGEISRRSVAEFERELKQLFASVVLQAQSQYAGFESLLSDYGVDRQLERQMPEPDSPRARKKRKATSQLSVGQVSRTRQVKIRVDQNGAELVSTTTESKWSAEASKIEE